MAFEWVAGLFQSEQTRGLSGDSAGSVALDDSNPYYNYRLRRHKAEGDVVADPGLLWYTSPYVKRRTGLGTHVAAEVGEGVANYTDVLIILSQDDHVRASASPAWIEQTKQLLIGEFDGFCRRESFRKLHADRPLGFRVLCDGSAEMGGKSLGLQRGEFVSGLLPNLYTGPVASSRPVIGVHVNLPGVWEGYREVGRLYNDQILFTLGDYWLDNFAHPSLREAALYRLQQYADGSFVHIINPDLQDRYQVTSTHQGGASVLTLATREGEPLAYIVLAVIEAQEAAPAPKPKGRPEIPMAPKGRNAPPEGIPSVAPPMMLDDEVHNIATGPSPKGGLGGKTIIPDAPSERIFTLQERGALLQKVHFGAFMVGYDVFVGSRGELGTAVETPAATFQVRKKSVAIVAHVGGIKIDGSPVMPGEETQLEKDVTIEVGGQKFEYRDLRGLEIEGWPYVAEIRRPASSTYVIWGEEYQIGRSRECRVVLPDEPRNDNIHWKPGVTDGATIRARTGDIPKSNFYTDSIMVASKHGIVDLRGDLPKVVCTATHCFIYIRRRGELLALYPTSRGMSPLEMDVEPGDEVLIGNCVFQLGYTPSQQAIAPSPAPKVELTTDALLGAVAPPSFEVEDAPATPAIRQRREPPTTRPDDAPSAYGLGERGVRPAPVPVKRVGSDSILGFSEDEVPSPPPARLAEAFPPAPPPSLDSVEDVDDEPTMSFSSIAVLGAAAATGAAVAFDAGPSLADAPPPLPDDAPPPLPNDAPPPPFDDAPPPPFDDAPPPLLDDAPPPLLDDAPPPLLDDAPPPLDVPPSLDAPPPILDEAPPPLPLDVPPSLDVPPPLVDDAPPPPPLDVPPSLAAPPPMVDDAPPPLDVPPSLDAPPPLVDDAPPPPVDAPPPLAGVEQPETPPELFTIPPSPDAPPAAQESAPVAPEPPPVFEAPPVIESPAPVAAPPTAAKPARVPVYTDDSVAQFELGRPMHLVLCGWMVNGDAVCGNHSGADLILPENRIVEDQSFEARDYFRLSVRGRRAQLDLLAPTELLVDEDDPKASSYDDPEAHTIDVIRRDDRGDEDFAVRLTFVEDRKLPDPRARYIAIDTEDPLAAALVTKGLPKGAPRRLEIGSITLTLTYDGATVRVSDYLATYRRGEVFHPFFVQKDGGRFKTAAEDGAEFSLVHGDRLVVGQEVYVLREE